MLTLFLVAVVSCSINLITATPFKDCGTELGTIVSFDVTNCPTAPCKLIKGSTYGMNLTFAAKAGSKTASVSIHGIIAGIPVPFPLNVSDACQLGVKCPIGQADNNMASLALPVLSSYPSLSLYIKLEVKADDQAQDYACVQFPATITGGFNADRSRVGWQKGKLFDMLN